MLVCSHLVHEIGVLKHRAAHLQQRKSLFHNPVCILAAGDSAHVDEREVRHRRLELLGFLQEEEMFERNGRGHYVAGYQHSQFKPPLLPWEIMHENGNGELSPHHVHWGPAHETSGEGDGLNAKLAHLLGHLNEFLAGLAALETVTGVELGGHDYLVPGCLHDFADAHLHKAHPVL